MLDRSQIPRYFEGLQNVHVVFILTLMHHQVISDVNNGVFTSQLVRFNIRIIIIIIIIICKIEERQMNGSCCFKEKEEFNKNKLS